MRRGPALTALCRLRHLLLGSVALLVPAGALAELSAEAAHGRAIVEAAECNRCHAVTDPGGGARGVAAAPRDLHCVDCHTWILDTRGDEAAIERARETFPEWDRYLENIRHFTHLPDLGTLTRRVRPEAVRAYLDAPHDLRPHLEESMIPLALSATEKDAVVAYLAALGGAPEDGVESRPDPAGIQTGAALFEARGCVGCHRMGDRGPATAIPAALLAPDLRFVRDRIPRATLVRFIQDPSAVDPKTAMPRMPVSATDAERLADYLLHAPLPPRTAAVPDAIPALARPVGWDEVYEEVLGFVCVHCHMDPARNTDGGPGNSGGLGYAGAGLNLETYEGVQAGLLRDGQRLDILKPPAPGEPPRLLAALLARRAEIGRGVPGRERVLGMPMGLPPLSGRQIAMVTAWLDQGAPGPQAD